MTASKFNGNQHIVKSNPLLSIIIPAYNAAQVIGRCLDSIVEQTFSDFEVIVINDCSRDATGEVLEKWSERDDRIQCMHLRVNGGVSRARNKGITLARGEYITFIDADDYVDREYLEKAMSVSAGYDLIVSGLKVGDHDKFEVIVPEADTAKKTAEIKNVYTKLDRERALLWGPYNKFYKRRIIDQNKLTFPIFSLGEDQCFVFNYFLYITSIKTIPYAGYYYIRNNNATLSRGVERSFEDVNQFLSLKFHLETELFRKLGLQPLSMDEFTKRNLLFYLARVFGMYSTKYKMEPKERRNTLKKIRKEPWGKHYKSSDYGIKYNLLKPIILSVPVPVSDIVLARLFKLYYR